ncbi:MAG: M23 family metallopeptidase [Clostridiales bacterium]|nr:M23 family metallopeptidase [Clostridiales bacterium]
MQSEKFWDKVRKAYQRYDRMMEKQGFYVVLGVCVLVIVISAVYTFRLRNETVEIPQVYEEVQSAGGNQNAQTLQEALIASQATAKPLSVPTEPPFSFVQPVSGVTIRQYSADEPQFFAAVNAWQIHGGIDLQAAYGTPVVASAAGTVERVWTSGEMGLCVSILHRDGYSTVYAGLCDASYVQDGDPVYQGQVIGHVGNGVLAESDAEPHLHFEVRRDEKAIDPLLVFLGIDKNNTL